MRHQYSSSVSDGSLSRGDANTRTKRTDAPALLCLSDSLPSLTRKRVRTEAMPGYPGSAEGHQSIDCFVGAGPCHAHTTATTDSPPQHSSEIAIHDYRSTDSDNPHAHCRTHVRATMLLIVDGMASLSSLRFSINTLRTVVVNNHLTRALVKPYPTAERHLRKRCQAAERRRDAACQTVCAHIHMSATTQPVYVVQGKRPGLNHGCSAGIRQRCQAPDAVRDVANHVSCRRSQAQPAPAGICILH